MGRLHARVYSEMDGVELVGVFDANPQAARDTAAQHGGQPFGSIDDLIASGIRAVTVAVPTTVHRTVAEPLLRAGIACLVEKPLAATSAEGRQIAQLAEASGTVVQVGHIERFNPVVRSLNKLGVEPRYIEVIRISPLTFRSIDVGVVLDMMIHDIDIVINLAKSEVVEVQAQGVSVIGGGIDRPAEDICNARLTFANGCVASLTASRLALKTERRLRVFSPETYVSLDYQKKKGVYARKTGNVDLLRETVEKIRSGTITDMAGLDYTKLVNLQELEIDDVEPLRSQAEAFVAAVRGEREVAIPASAGVAAVEVAERIVDAVAGAQV
jgi:predicted dehydrogenase